MATVNIPRPVAPSPRTSTHANGSDNDEDTSLAPTRPVGLVEARHAVRASVINPFPAAPSSAARRLSGPGNHRRSSRDNTADSTVLSKSSDHWSDEGYSDDSSEDDVSLPASPQTRFVPPPPSQPLPFHSTANLRPATSWHPGSGAGGGRPPSRLPYDIPSTASESESPSEYSDGCTRSLSQRSGSSELEELVEAKRRSIWQLRQAMAKKRKELRDLRRRKDDIDNAFMQTFRPYLTKTRVAVVPTDLLSERFREMQSIRDEYYAAESVYEAMELELDKQELALEMLEADFARIPRGRASFRRPGPIRSRPQPITKPMAIEAERKDGLPERNDSRPPSPVSLLGISGELHEDIHPLYQELLEAAGDRQLAAEYCEDLEMHREKILYDLELELHRKRVRSNQGNLISEADLRSLRSSLTNVPADAAEFQAAFGIPISEDDLEFLRDYETVQKRAKKELEEASKNLKFLRELCIEKGVMRKHASYHEEVAIFSGSNWTPTPADGNIAIESAPMPATSGLAHPRFPILLSNPSHVLELRSPIEALEQALKLPKDDPMSAQRRAECMKELGISTLMKKVENIPDYINQWLIHRLRTSPMEAELMLAVCESVFKVVNLRRWQEEVLYYWRLDDAAKLSPLVFQGAQTPREDDELGLGVHGFGLLGAEDGSRSQLNSVIEQSARVKSDDAAEAGVAVTTPLREREASAAKARSARSVG